MVIGITTKASWEHYPLGISLDLVFPPAAHNWASLAVSGPFPAPALRPKADSHTNSMHQLFLPLRGRWDCTARLWGRAFSSPLYWSAGQGLCFATPSGPAGTTECSWPGTLQRAEQHSSIWAAEDLSLKLFQWGLSGLMLNIVFLYSC